MNYTQQLFMYELQLGRFIEVHCQTVEMLNGECTRTVDYIKSITHNNVQSKLFDTIEEVEQFKAEYNITTKRTRFKKK